MKNTVKITLLICFILNWIVFSQGMSNINIKSIEVLGKISWDNFISALLGGGLTLLGTFISLIIESKKQKESNKKRIH